MSRSSPYTFNAICARTPGAGGRRCRWGRRCSPPAAPPAQRMSLMMASRLQCRGLEIGVDFSVGARPRHARPVRRGRFGARPGDFGARRLELLGQRCRCGWIRPARCRVEQHIDRQAYPFVEGAAKGSAKKGTLAATARTTTSAPASRAARMVEGPFSKPGIPLEPGPSPTGLSPWCQLLHARQQVRPARAWW